MAHKYDKYYRWVYYILTGSVILFAGLYIWVYINDGAFAKADFLVKNNEPYDIHLKIESKTKLETTKLFSGSIKQDQQKLIEKFTYGEGQFLFTLNKKHEFLIGNFNDEIDFHSALVVKDNKISLSPIKE